MSFLATYHVEPHGALRPTVTDSITSFLPLSAVEISSDGLPTLSSAMNLDMYGLSSVGSSEQKGFGKAASRLISRHRSSTCFRRPDGTSVKSSIGTISPFMPDFWIWNGRSNNRSLCSPDATQRSALGIFLGMCSVGFSMSAGNWEGSGSCIAARILWTWLYTLYLQWSQMRPQDLQKLGSFTRFLITLSAYSPL